MRVHHSATYKGWYEREHFFPMRDMERGEVRQGLLRRFFLFLASLC